MGSQHPDEIDFAGDYNLNGIIIQAHDGTGGSKIEGAEGGVNIQSLVQELNIYEGINQAAIYGTLVIVDSVNLIANLPIQGTERLFFKLSTPGTTYTENIIDASEETGHPFYVYKVSNRQQPSQGNQVYTIHFASREFMRNIRTKVSKAYDGKMSSIVQQIISEKNGLDSRKKLYYEETKNSDKIVMPNISPFKAISMVAKKAMPNYSNGVGYYFYETTKGFYFRSWDNMCVDYGNHAKTPIQTYRFIPQNVNEHDNVKAENNEEDPTLTNLQSVESYKFMNTFHDTAAAQALGTYGHRVIAYNLYGKSYNINDFHYHNEFNQTRHVDYNFDNDTENKPAVRDNPVDFDIRPDGRGKGVSDYAESLVTLLPTSQYVHGDAGGGFGTNILDDAKLEGIRNTQIQQVTAGTTVQMTVHGQTQIQPGELIHFELRPIEEEGQTVDRKTYDPQYSGRYIITKIRHRVTKQEYKMILECRKDSVREQLPGQSIRNFTGTTNNENTQYQQLNKIYRGGK